MSTSKARSRRGATGEETPRERARRLESASAAAMDSAALRLGVDPVELAERLGRGRLASLVWEVKLLALLVPSDRDRARALALVETIFGHSSGDLSALPHDP